METTRSPVASAAGALLCKRERALYIVYAPPWAWTSTLPLSFQPFGVMSSTGTPPSFRSFRVGSYRLRVAFTFGSAATSAASQERFEVLPRLRGDSIRYLHERFPLLTSLLLRCCGNRRGQRRGRGRRADEVPAVEGGLVSVTHGNLGAEGSGTSVRGATSVCHAALQLSRLRCADSATGHRGGGVTGAVAAGSGAFGTATATVSAPPQTE